jgi:hypothetical protein
MTQSMWRSIFVAERKNDIDNHHIGKFHNIVYSLAYNHTVYDNWDIYAVYEIKNNGEIMLYDEGVVNVDEISDVYSAVSGVFTAILKIQKKNLLSLRERHRDIVRTSITDVCRVTCISMVADDEPFELRFIPTIRGILSAIRNKYELDISRL